MNPLPSPELAAIIKENTTLMEPLTTQQDPSLDRLQGIRGIVFDVYGTLLISGVGDISLASSQDRDSPLKAAVEAVGFSWLEEDVTGLSEQFKETIIRQQKREQEERKGLEFPEVEIREVWETFLEDLVNENRIRGEIYRKRLAEVAVRYELSVNPVAPMPGAEAVLKALQARQLPVGIISNAQFFTPLMLEVLLGGSLEDFGVDPLLNVWSYLEREGKPSRALYEKAASLWKTHYQAKPSQLLYIGNDMRNDIWPSSKVGFRTGLFAGDARSLRLREEDPECRSIQPDCVFTELSQIPEVI